MGDGRERVRVRVRPNPAIAGLAVVLVSVVAAGAALINAHRARPAPVLPVRDRPEPPPSQADPILGQRWTRPRPPPPACVPEPRRACVVGRIEFPRSIPSHPAFADLTLTVFVHPGGAGDGDGNDNDDGADDERRGGGTIPIEPDGRFRLQLSAGRYDFNVTGSPLAQDGGAENQTDDPTDETAYVGGREDLRVPVGAVIDDLVIAMERAVSIDGTVRGMRDIPVTDATITVRRSGQAARAAADDIADAPDVSAGADDSEVSVDLRGRFHIGGLRAGTYDLVVDGGSSHRDRTLRGVLAPAPAVTIDLPRHPLLLGAFRADADGSCPSADLQIIEDPREDTREDPREDPREDTRDDPFALVTGGDRCTFVVELKGSVGQIHVVGDIHGADGQPVSQWVIVPPAADPSPLCLLGPCTEPSAAVVVLGLSGQGGRVVPQGLQSIAHRIPATTAIRYALGAPEGQGLGLGLARGGRTLSGARPALTIFDDLPAGRWAQFFAVQQDKSGEADTVVRPGVNELVIDLLPLLPP